MIKEFAHEMADTGLWHLSLHISPTDMAAWLRSVGHGAPEERLLFHTRWQQGDATLLQRIENEVYDHPQLLDDFSTDIIIQSPRTLAVPTAILENDEHPLASEHLLYSCIYPCEEEDIMADRVDDVTLLFTLTPGLAGFLSRTLPGARIRSHLGVMLEHFRRHTSSMPRLYADIRDEETDLLLLDCRRLLALSTQPWHAPTDIVYRILHMIQAYDLTADGVEVRLSGLSEVKTEVMTMLREILDFVTLGNVPSATDHMPLASALLAAKRGVNC